MQEKVEIAKKKSQARKVKDEDLKPETFITENTQNIKLLAWSMCIYYSKRS